MDSARDSEISVSEPMPPNVSFFFSNFHYLIPIKLNEHNYPIWKIECEGALKACSLFHYVQQSQAQSPTITDSNGSSIPNPNYFSWFLVESHVRSCLLSTLSPTILAQVTHTRTALELCEFLEQKFAKPTYSSGQDSGELASGNQFRRIAPQSVSTAICQICANGGRIAAHCSYPSSAFASNAIKVFDGSPDRELLAIADGSNASADTTPLPNATGTRSLLKPDSRFVDRLASPCEEMLGHQTVQGSGIPKRVAFQQKSGPHISGAKQKVVSTQANHEMNHSGSKQTAPTPYCETDISSDPQKKNKMALFCTPGQVSRLWVSKQDSDKNNENGDSSKETGNAVEHTHSTSNMKIQNSEDAGLEGVPLPVYGGNSLVLMGSNGNINTEISQGTKVEGNSLQVNKTSNVAAVAHTIDSRGAADDQKIQNTPISQGTQVEENFSQVNKTPNCSKVIESRGATDSQKIQRNPKRKLEGESFQVNKKLNGGNAVSVSGTTDSEKIQNCLQRNPEGKPMEVYRQLNGGSATIEIKRTADEQKILNLTVTTPDQKIHNSQEENPLESNKKLNSCSTIDLVETADHQKIQNSLNSSDATELAETTDNQNIQVCRREKRRKVIEKLSGGNAVELTGTGDHQKIQNSPEREVEENSMEASKILSGGEAMDLTGTAPDQKIENPQEIKLGEYTLQGNEKVNGDNEKIELEGKSLPPNETVTGSVDDRKTWSPQEQKLEARSPLQGNKMLNGTIDVQKKQNPQTARVEDSWLQVNKNLSGGDAKQSNYFMFWCDLCKAGNHNEKTWTEHLNGKKHRKQLQRLNQIAVFGGVSGDLKEGLKMVNEPEVVAKEVTSGLMEV